MTHREIDRTKPAELASLMQFPAEEYVGDVWHDDELAELCRHQLDTPLAIDLDEDDGEAGAEGPSTFAGLLLDENPPQVRLEQGKDYFKRHGREDGSLPKSLAAAFYLACIATALVQLDVRITDADNAALLAKMKWAGSLPWLDTRLIALFSEAEASLSGQ